MGKHKKPLLRLQKNKNHGPLKREQHEVEDGNKTKLVMDFNRSVMVQNTQVLYQA